MGPFEPADGPGRRWLGLDEAGRGCVLGPLVVGGFLVDEATASQLPSLGVRDSKRLTPVRRASVYRALARAGTRVSLAIPPATVDRAVRQHRLNRLEATAFAQLIRRIRPDAVFLDACEVEEARFGAEVAEKAGYHGPMDARNHADRDLPVVGAASIVAKVRRDAAVARLQRRAPTEIGSGYPADPVTLAYLRDVVRPGRPVPAGIRTSWRTTQRVMAERTRTTLDRFAP